MINFVYNKGQEFIMEKNEDITKKIIMSAQQAAHECILEQKNIVLSEYMKSFDHDETLMFKYMYAKFCASYCIEELKNTSLTKDILQKSLKIYIDSIIDLKETIFTYSLATLRSVVNTVLPELTEWSGGKRKIKESFINLVCQKIENHPHSTTHKSGIAKELFNEN